jgi:2-polyprenyl-6-hydroxyphenyl methylase / 3-demethylubiquinone-9 3-methyltransferase
MQIDNDMYFRTDFDWWDDGDNSLGTLLRHHINPLRFAYFQRAIAATSPAPSGRALLDVGCGGGFLSEEFAKHGYQVTGVDPSPHLVATARAHAKLGGLDIAYVTGYGEELPFPDASFDLVACCDVLEHVDALGPVVAEIARVLKPGGLFLFDTINRTWLSWLFVIKVAQDWKSSAWEAPRTHVWSKLVKPEELAAAMAAHGLHGRELRGIDPACNPLTLYRRARQRAKGLITRRELAAQLHLRESDHLAASYMGHAVKADKVAP